MRLCIFKCRRRYTFLVGALKLTLFFILWRLYYPPSKEVPKPAATAATAAPPHPSKPPNRHITKMITIVIRQFESFENDIAPSVQSVLTLLPNIPVVIVADAPPYPPFEFTVPNKTLKNVKLVNLELNLMSNAKEANPLTHIKSKYVLFLPDSVRITSRQGIQQMLTHALKSGSGGGVVAAPFASSRGAVCQRVELNLREWSIRYEQGQSKGRSNCSAVQGKHALLLPSALLHVLPRPFMLPFPEALYLQTVVRSIKVVLLPELSFSDGRALYRSQPFKQNLRVLENNRRTALYQASGIKKVLRESGSVEWYGCTRDSERCFPPVIGLPSYVSLGRWTPPCCLAHLRRTLRHALTSLQQAGARCWLEGKTLLGAVKRGDALPWASNLEIGIYESDVPHSQWLVRAAGRGGVQDPQGFLWEKATQGEYFRVLFSKHNRLHVDILPFRQKNGTMAKDSWFVEHQTDFPDHFLHPMSSIEFAGKQMPCPNNVKEFLELKFGKGSVD